MEVTSLPSYIMILIFKLLFDHNFVNICINANFKSDDYFGERNSKCHYHRADFRVCTMEKQLTLILVIRKIK